MKSLSLLSALVLLAACANDPAAPAAARIPQDPSLTWVFDTPRPSVVSAEVVGKGGPGYNIVRITWSDPTVDEDWNALYFTSPTESPMVLNAPGYADTDTRVADLSVPIAFTSVAVSAVWAADATHDESWRTPYSNPVAITSDGALLTATGKGKGKK